MRDEDSCIACIYVYTHFRVYSRKFLIITSENELYSCFNRFSAYFYIFTCSFTLKVNPRASLLYFNILSTYASEVLMKKQLTKIFQSICTNVYVHLSFFKIRVSGIKNIMSAGNDLMWKEAFVLVVTVFKRLRRIDENRTTERRNMNRLYFWFVLSFFLFASTLPVQG